MIAVIFEVGLNEGKLNEYVDISESLKIDLSKCDGFISVERVKSIKIEHKYLSLSYWKNEDSIKQWKEFEKHKAAQNMERKSILIITPFEFVM